MIMLEDADVLIIVPPFAPIEMPSLAAHTLQAVALKEGHRISVFYANLLFASLLGEENYLAFSKFSVEEFVKEKYIARKIKGNTEKKIQIDLENSIRDSFQAFGYKVDVEKILESDDILGKWREEIVDFLTHRKLGIIGFSSSFEQNMASFFLLEGIKEKNIDATIIIGGANCEGEMAEGILSLSEKIDYVFSGESENSFVEFIDKWKRGEKVEGRIISGKPYENLNETPLLDYSEYYEQIRSFLPKSKLLENGRIILAYETSRGCWWGDKNKCNFCGLNGEKKRYREKSIEKAIEEIDLLIKKHPSRIVGLIDNVIPRSYSKRFFIEIAKKVPDIKIACECRTKMGFRELYDMKKAGVVNIQPGIEALSTKLLRRMNKGVLARHNIAFLRHAKMLKIYPSWNLLYAFPGDQEEEYVETLEIVKMIMHLDPPLDVNPLIIERFSRYFNFPNEFGIEEIYPFESYNEFLPKNTDVNKVAYHFKANYPSFSKNKPKIIKEISAYIKKWIKEWKENSQERLELRKVKENKYMIYDSRLINIENEIFFVDRAGAKSCILNRQKNKIVNEEKTKWALEKKFIVEVDSWYVSLVVCEPEIYIELMS